MGSLLFLQLCGGFLVSLNTTNTPHFSILSPSPFLRIDWKKLFQRNLSKKLKGRGFPPESGMALFLSNILFLVSVLSSLLDSVGGRKALLFRDAACCQLLLVFFFSYPFFLGIIWRVFFSDLLQDSMSSLSRNCPPRSRMLSRVFLWIE